MWCDCGSDPLVDSGLNFVMWLSYDSGPRAAIILIKKENDWKKIQLGEHPVSHFLSIICEKLYIFLKLTKCLYKLSYFWAGFWIWGISYRIDNEYWVVCKWYCFVLRQVYLV